MKVNAYLITIFIIGAGLVNLINAQPVILNEVLQLNNAQPNYSARSAAVGGAYTSLGADIVSFYQNSAGLAMYRSTEVFYGPGLSFKNISSDFGGSRNREANFLYEGGTGGIVITTKRNRSKLKYINYGFAFHRSKNNNYRKSYTGLDEYTDEYGNEIVLELEENIATEGSRYSELAFAIAANYNDKFFMGLNITTPRYIFNQEIDFSSRDINDIFYFSERNLTETYSISTDNSFSLGIGFVYKLNNNFRIGANAKTSSLLTMEEEYLSSEVEIDDYEYATAVSNNILEYYVLRSTPQFNGGISYLNKKGFVSVDVGFINNKRYLFLDDNLTENEISDYRFEGNDLLRSIMKNSFLFKIGGEFVPNQNLRLRAGYNFTTSPLQNNDLYSGTHNISVGAGVRKAVFVTESNSRTVFADAALKYSFYKSQYEIFADLENGPLVDFKYNQLQLITTFGFKF